MLAALVHRQNQPGLPAAPANSTYEQDHQEWADELASIKTIEIRMDTIEELQRRAGRLIWLVHAFAVKHAAVLAENPDWPAMLADMDRWAEAVIRWTPEAAGESQPVA